MSGNALSVLVFVCVLPASFCHAADALSAKSFLGPIPGVRYFYADGHGTEMTVRGIAWTDSGVLMVEEETVFPALPSEECGGMRTLSEVYGLYVVDSRLMRRGYPLNGGVKDSILLDLGTKHWANPVALLPAGTHDLHRATPGLNVCRQADKTQRKLFGKERTVLAIRCSRNIPSKYASDIGLIGQGNMELVHIEVGGKKVGTY
ncbi:hypothetical protein [Pseudodesulfovibrio portus]|nr:hypothetical protein [Pseudodesulfovibrio portus]